mmetsp:Transcript_35545/g.74941  ORF Transcript_35545/g.74941 Transcript_35545/m.74941 type:complete len:339 (-) Transcript_35545:72-1088(-)
MLPSMMRTRVGVMQRCLLCAHRQQHTPSITRSLRVAINILVRGKHSETKSKRRSQSSKKWLERQQKDPYVQKAQEQGLPSRASFKLQEINEVHFPALRLKNNAKKGKGNKPNASKHKRLIQPGMLVLDLGAAPGGWSLYASTQLNHDLGGALVAVDLLPLDDTLNSNNTDISSRIKSNLQYNFEFIQGDFTIKETHTEIMDALESVSKTTTKNEDSPNNDTTEFVEIDRRPNLIISDMAPNFLGDSQSDAIRTLNLCEQALAFAAGYNCFDPSYSTKDKLGMLADNGAFLCKYFSCGKENEADLMEATRRAFRTVHVIKPRASRRESSEMYLLALGFR